MNRSRITFFLFLISVSIFSSKVVAQSVFHKPLLRFDITLKNPGKVKKMIKYIGVKSKILNENIPMCKKGDDPLKPRADYRIPFYIGAPETVIEAEPPLTIAGGDYTRFTVSLAPEATGYCGPWATNITVFIVFDTGERVITSQQLLTSGNVAVYQKRIPEKEELLAALRDRNAEVRIQAIERLPESKIQRVGIEQILLAKLEDTDASVRSTAALTAAEMGFKIFIKKISSLLEITPESSQDIILTAQKSSRRRVGYSEFDAYCNALGEFRDATIVEPLLAALLRSNSLSTFSNIKRILTELEHPDVPAKITPLLSKYYKWTLETADDSDAERYASLCEIIIYYKDIKSIPLLSKILQLSEKAKIYNSLSLYLENQTDDIKILQDPFILAMKPTFEAILNHHSYRVRLSAITILSRFPLKKEEIESILRVGLKDNESYVRQGVADIIGRTGYKSLTPEILLLLKVTSDANEKEKYCRVLEKFKVLCPSN